MKNNKRCIITGGTKGIGFALAECFAKKGFDLAICSRNKADLQRCKADLEQKKEGCNVLVFKADVSDKKQVDNFAKFIKNEWDTIDVLINNAGTFLPGFILDAPDGQLEQMMQTNLYSAYHLTRHLSPGMIKQKSGHIFNICSVASIKILDNSSSYCITKFALHGFSKALREEMKPHGVKVTSVLPGATWSASWEGVGVPAERMMKASDIAETIMSAYLLSKNAVIEELVMRPQLGDV